MRGHSHFTAYLALGAVCFLWGTTYVAIRIALESFPPATLMCVRYVISGGVLLLGARIAGAHLPRGRELLLTAVYGAVTIGFGTGALAFSEQWIPSGIAAIFLTTSPFWMVGMEALLPGGDRLHRPAVIGMLVGFSGTILLVLRDVLGSHAGAGLLWKGFLLLQFGCCAWAFGSISQRRHATSAHPVVGGGIQQLATGLAYLIPALSLKTESAHWNARGVLAILYLAIFGGIIGYSCYSFALDRLPVSIVSIYTYINPIVAVCLGWLFYREPFGPREAAAMAIIFLGVALVKRYGQPKSKIPVIPPAASRGVERQQTIA